MHVQVGWGLAGWVWFGWALVQAVGGFQVCSTCLSSSWTSCCPEHALLMVLAKVLAGRPSCVSTFQYFVCTVPSSIMLTKAGHLAELENQGGKKYTSFTTRWCQRCKCTTCFGISGLIYTHPCLNVSLQILGTCSSREFAHFVETSPMNQ